MSDLADAVASLTAEATHKSAEGLTMLPFAQTLATNRLMSEWLRWCPLCLEDSEHERLAWSLVCVEACARHQVVLASRCPGCRTLQRPMSGRAVVGRCRKCQKLLAEATTTPAGGWDLWVAEQVGALLAATPPNVSPALALKRVLQERAWSAKALAERSGLGEATISYWLNGKTKPTLDIALRAASGLEMTLSGLLASTFDRSNAVPAIPPTAWKLRRSHDPEHQRYVLDAAMADPSCPSLQSVAAGLQVFVRDLRNAWPEQAKVIVARRADAMVERRKQREADITAQVEAAVVELRSLGLDASRRNLERKLDGLQVREKTVRRAWQASAIQTRAA